MSTPRPKRKFSIRQKIHEKLAKVRKTPVVTEEQKLQVKIDSMNTEAQELFNECTALQTKATTFTSRAETTPLPEAPPGDRQPLFERDPKAPSDHYDAQIKAYGVLLAEWHVFEKEAKGFGKKLEGFCETVENMKKKHFEQDKAIDKTGHEFIGLDNALFKLKEQKGELSRGVAAVPLPAGK